MKFILRSLVLLALPAMLAGQGFLLYAGNGETTVISSIGPPPAAPTLLTPTNTAIDVPVDQLLKWTAPAGATSYMLQVSTDPTFSFLTYEITNITTAPQGFQLVSYYTTYYWRVRAFNSDGASDWSTVWSFITAHPAPPPPTQILPADGATDLPVGITLRWDDVNTAFAYVLEIATDQNFTNSLWVPYLGETAYIMNSLEYNTTYYWRLRCFNVSGTGEWSDIRTFTTAPESLTEPGWVSQSSGSTAFLNDVFFTDVNTGIVIGSGGTILRTTNGGDTWIPHSSGTTNWLYRLSFVNADIGVIAGSGGKILRTTDGGVTWSNVVSGVTAELYAVSFGDAMTGTIVGSSGTILRTTNAGLSWTLQTSGTSENLWSVSFTDVDNGVVGGTGGKILLTSDGGGTWSQSPPYSNGTLDIYGISFNGVDAWTAIGTADLSNTNYIYQGEGVDIDPLESMQLNRFPATLHQIFFVSTQTGTVVGYNWGETSTLLRTTNGGYTWTEQNSGTSDRLMGVHFSDTQNGTIVGENGTILRTTTGGEPGAPIAPSAPLLASPANAATNVSLTPTLSWNSTAGADAYKLQVSANADFSLLTVDEGDITGTSQQVSGLDNNTLYYWRVSASNNIGESPYSTIRTFTTVVGAPAVPTLAEPADNALNLVITPTLKWNPVPGALSYRLEVSPNADFSVLVHDQSGITDTSKQLSTLSNNTKYYWRVRATNAGGNSAYSDARSFTTVVALPGVPVLASPAHNAAGAAIDLTFGWSSVLGVLTYTLQISTDSVFSEFAFDIAGIVSASKEVNGLANNTTYFWRVAGVNVAGIGIFSEVRKFTTIVAFPAIPILGLPGSGTTNVSITPTLNWNSVIGAASYRLQVSADAGFSTLLIDQSGITDTTKSVAGLANNTVYYWRVSAINAAGASLFSDAKSFTTIIAVPLAPLLALPNDGATGVALSPVLMWNTSLTASSYRLQVSTSPTFSSVLYDQSGLTDSSQMIVGLANNTVYYWRVSATNIGGTSLYSTVRSFTTIAGTPVITAPATPALSAPNDGAMGVSVAPLLSWEVSPGAVSYSLQVSTNPDFSSYVYNQGGLLVTSQSVSGLMHSTEYYWRVNATNAGGTSAYSVARSFTTTVAAPDPPVLESPSDNAINVSTDPTLIWQSVTGAASYTLQIASDPLFQVLFEDSQNIPGTSRKVYTNLEHNTMYYWRVSATNEGGTSAYSPARKFFTVIGAPDTPSPVDFAVNVPTNPTLSWNAVEGAETYTLQVTTSLSFASPVFNQVGITATSQLVNGLEPFTQYYWRVMAISNTSVGAFSSIWSFTTGGSPTSVQQVRGGAPTEFELRQNFPNPFNPVTTIHFSVPKESRVILSIFNSLGIEVGVLVDETVAPGSYQVQWTPQNMPSGVYFYRLRTPEFTSTRKLTLLR